MSASTSTLKSNPKPPKEKKNPEFLSEKPEQQALAAAAIGSLKIPSFLQQQTKVMHPKYYKHLKKCSPKKFGQTKNGLVSGRLVCTSSKTEISNKKFFVPELI